MKRLRLSVAQQIMCTSKREDLGVIAVNLSSRVVISARATEKRFEIRLGEVSALSATSFSKTKGRKPTGFESLTGFRRNST